METAQHPPTMPHSRNRTPSGPTDRIFADQREDKRTRTDSRPRQGPRRTRPRAVTDPRNARRDKLLGILMVPSHVAAATCPPCKQLVVSSDAMKNHRLAPNAIDKQEVVTQVTFRQSGPVRVAPEIITSKMYSRVSGSNSGCFFAER